MNSVEPTPAAPEPPRRWPRLLITWSGWIAAVLLGLLELPAKINSLASELPELNKNLGIWWWKDHRFTGTWTTQAEFELGLPEEMYSNEDHRVDLTIEVNSGELEMGEIVSTGLERHYVFSRVMLRGLVKGSKLHAEVWDYISGRPTALAPFTLEPVTIGGVQLLRLTSDPTKTRLLPASVLLTRSHEDMPPGDLNLGVLRGAVEQTVERSSEAAEPAGD
jgi:hypothetical protein